ncbi:MAG: hypothetical protein ACU0CA_13435 [Paracoccaceae bacterium]
MALTELLELAKNIESLPSYDAALTRKAFEAVQVHLPDMDKSMIQSGAFGSVDVILLAIDHAFPGWALTMNGIASEGNGHWKCSLRQSEVRDNDAFLGAAHGPLLSNVLIGTFLKALAYRVNHE